MLLNAIINGKWLPDNFSRYFMKYFVFATYYSNKIPIYFPQKTQHYVVTLY